MRICICIYVYMRVCNIRIYMYIRADWTYAYTYIYICLARLVIAEMNNQIGRERGTVNQTISNSIVIIVIIIQYRNNIMIRIIKIR